MQLVIVESPTKARKLRSYLGSDYQVEASMGHVRDLPKKQLGIDLEGDFSPEYVNSEGKTKVISSLKKLAKTASKVILATDPDREGEAIAWHLQELIKKGEFVRATFHEITKSAVLAAINNPIKLNLHLVDAQQARRVIDRLVGYKISPVLWRKIRRGLSAGRVQSVALRLIVEREKEILEFKPEEYWEVDVALAKTQFEQKVFTKEGKVVLPLHEEVLIARPYEWQELAFKPKSNADVQPVTAFLHQAKYRVLAVEQKERKVSSLPPFITSSLQQAAATRLGMTSKQSMKLAQDLYEQGFITYHRTDSYNLSQSALNMAREYIKTQIGAEYVPSAPRYFANKAKNTQEAHEAIRVTEVNKDSVLSEAQMSERHQKLYDLIRRRFLASQMSAAVYSQTSVSVEAKQGSVTCLLRANGSILRFSGWKKLFPAGEDQLLPDLKVGQTLHFADLAANQKFTQPPPRYNDASLVKELEKKGIGRPSTYAPTISLIEDRGYVERKEKKFFPTQIGISVCQFLLANFTQLMQYEFTAQMEDDLDSIANGKKDWKALVKGFYKPLAGLIDEVQEKAERVKIPVEETGESCPQCGQSNQGMLVIRTGKFGKFKSCNRFPDCKFTQNLVETLAGLQCPVCNKGAVTVKKSRWGRVFYGCSTYPACDWAASRPPQPNESISSKQWQQMKAERAERSKKYKARFSKKIKKSNKSTKLKNKKTKK